jgi:type III restriction enzyme
VKNAGVGFAIPCFYTGQDHDYLPDFIVRLELPRESFLILECKGFPDEHKDDKAAGAKRWVRAVNEDGRYGLWDYERAEHPPRVKDAIERAAARLSMAATQADMVTS